MNLKPQIDKLLKFKYFRFQIHEGQIGNAEDCKLILQISIPNCRICLDYAN